jgi:2-keto-4-pentenoate hydratase/2-oxohepta-3-ene-1,7-dioic acid hydratase in catechol pathway
MKLLRVGEAGRERPVLVDDEQYFDLRPVTPDIDPVFFASDGIHHAREALARGSLPPTSVGDLRVGAPIARPGAVLCIGQNYSAHAAESGAEIPTAPILFYKSPNTVVGPNDEVYIPRGSTRTDWEVEVGVVIGSRARYLDSEDDALACIAGYVLSNDVSERAFQFEHSNGQWSKGKSCETFNPLGPWLVTSDEIPDPQTLALRSWVNGESRQDATTKDMIFPIAELIYHLSQYLVLDPGDLINTGTPDGVALSGLYPYLKAGDVVEMEIERLGTQRQVFRNAP